MLLTFRPYGMPYLDNGILGRDACVVAGIMNLVGSHDVTIQVREIHQRQSEAWRGDSSVTFSISS